MANGILVDIVAAKILLIRGKRVMLDRDLSKLYEVDTGQLTRQVRRNIDRFPEDFMFQLTREEFENLMCQNGISSWGGTRKLPYVFTEQGVAMLSSVLRSKRAIRVNIQIMRAFIQLRRVLLTSVNLKRKIEELEKKYDKQFLIVFKALKELIEPPPIKKKGPLGFYIEKPS
ncbi:MAG: ORF6N domain-containing protein [Candidatus Omnitrophica bacterium]|nr:ORF6N domain-containing protein [Candidatus Omnitrophota bacterium]